MGNMTMTELIAKADAEAKTEMDFWAMMETAPVAPVVKTDEQIVAENFWEVFDVALEMAPAWIACKEEFQEWFDAEGSILALAEWRNIQTDAEVNNRCPHCGRSLN